MKEFFPEGTHFSRAEGAREIPHATLLQAMETGAILQAPVLSCNENHDLTVDLGCMKGIIPRTEGAIGIREGTVRDIAVISCVGKPVCFCVTGFGTDPAGRPLALLSRRAAQEKYRAFFRETVRPGDVLPARVTHLESFGAFCDIGCGLIALMPIDAISVSRISSPKDRFCVGQEIRVVVRQIAEDGKITVSQKELLGTWEENAALFSPRQTVSGIIRSVEEYGVFVELTPNLAGLAEPKEGVRVGQVAGVYIKSILPEKMKIKLIIIDSFFGDYRPDLTYFFTGNHLDRFDYSPAQCPRKISTVF